MLQKSANPLLLFGIIAFLFVGFLGLPHFGMNMNFGGIMPSCLAMGMVSVCQMNPLEHILAWQGIFTFTFNQKDILAAIFLLLAATLGVMRLLARYVVSLLKSLLKVSSLRRQYARTRASFLSPLQEAFSNGILNPKIF